MNLGAYRLQNYTLWVKILAVVLIMILFCFQLYGMNVKGIQAVKPPSDEIKQAEQVVQLDITTSDELIKPVQDVQFDVPPANELQIIIIACGSFETEDKKKIIQASQQFNRTKSFINSALIMTKEMLHFHVIVDNTNFFKRLKEEIYSTLSIYYGAKIRMTKYDVWYPPQAKFLREIYKPCATEALFLHEMFPHLHQVLYIDTDTIFLRPPEHIFQLFQNFNSNQSISMAERFKPSKKWPIYKTGLNSGVILMDFHKMRQPKLKWTERMLAIIEKYEVSFF